jgi:hypothetical protein
MSLSVHYPLQQTFESLPFRILILRLRFEWLLLLESALVYYILTLSHIIQQSLLSLIGKGLSHLLLEEYLLFIGQLLKLL